MEVAAICLALTSGDLNLSLVELDVVAFGSRGDTEPVQCR